MALKLAQIVQPGDRMHTYRGGVASMHYALPEYIKKHGKRVEKILEEL